MNIALHDLADQIINAHAPVSATSPRRRKVIHSLVDRAAASGVLTDETVDWLVSTAVLGRHVWYPEQVEALVAAGFLVDDGPVAAFPERRYYVLAEGT